MYVFKDNITDGHWHYCYDCGKSGDLLELASGVWGMTKQGALQKLRLEGFKCPELTPELLERYDYEHRQRQERWQELWVKASKQLAQHKSSGLAALRSRYKLLGQYSAEAWLAGPGKFVGGASVKQIEGALTVASSIRPSGRSREQIFPGPHWKDALVVPYYSAPERISGMWFMGRNGSKDSRIFHGVAHVRGGVQAAEAGLAGLSSVNDSRGQFGPYVFAVEDPLVMLRLQVRHMQTSTLPLPLVSFYEGKVFRTYEAWHSLLHNKVILWTWHLTPSILWNAMRSNADLSIVKLDNPSKKSLAHWLRLMTPRDVMRKALRQAKPWREAVAEWVSEAQPGALEELLIGLHNYPDVDAARLTSEIGALVDTPLLLPRIRTLRISSEVEVIDRDDGWYFIRTVKALRRPDVTMRLLTDAKIVVKRVVMGELPRYEGLIEFQGQTIPYSVGVSTATYEPKQWLIMTCLRAGVGRPYVAQSKIPLFDVALALSKPECVMAGSEQPPEPPAL